jgi:molecular chaperone GrpE (heat shock protein)
MPESSDQPTPETRQAPGPRGRLRRTRAEERIADLDVRPVTLLAQIEALTNERDAALARAEENLALAQRAQADYANLRRRSAEDRKLRSLLDSEGVTPIEALGAVFDPTLHEAVSHLPGTGRPEGEVVAEIRRGYRIRDRVLRPALVAVSDGTGETDGRPA